MNYSFKVFSILLFVFLFNLPVLADSPLTSTPFYQAYSDVPEVVKAEGSAMSEWIFEYLTDEDKPLENRMALINAMGWNINGTHNGAGFIDLIAERLDKEPGELKIEDLSGEELLCLGYLLALDDYFTLGPARTSGGELETADVLTLVELASGKLPHSFTAQLIASLVKAQKLLESDWGGLYITVKETVESEIKRDMRDEAVAIIMDYIGIYEEYASPQRIPENALEISPLKEREAPMGVYSIELSPDGKRIITRSGNETTVRIWDSSTGELLKVIDSGEFTDFALFAPQGNLIFISDWTPKVSIYSSEDYTKIKDVSFSSRIMDMAINPDGSEAIFARFDGYIEIYSPGGWKRLDSFPAHKGYVSTVKFSSDGKVLLTGSYDCTVKLWDVEKKYELLDTIKDFSDGTFAYFLPGDKEIIVRDYTDTVSILDISSGKVIRHDSLPSTVHGVCWNPSGEMVLIATETGYVYIWRLKDNKDSAFMAHSDQVMDVKFSPQGDRLFTCGLENIWKVWDVKDLSE